mgnify:CR=1 FL=1
MPEGDGRGDVEKIEGRAAGQADAGVDHVRVSLQFLEHPRRVIQIARLPENPPAECDHGVRAQILGGLHRPHQLGRRITTPDALGDQQARRVDRLHRHVVALGERLHRVDVLADGLGPHHQFDAVITQPGGVFEGGLGPQRVHRGRRESDLDRGTHGTRVSWSRA